MPTTTPRPARMIANLTGFLIFSAFAAVIVIHPPETPLANAQVPTASSSSSSQGMNCGALKSAGRSLCLRDLRKWCAKEFRGQPKSAIKCILDGSKILSHAAASSSQSSILPKGRPAVRSFIVPTVTTPGATTQAPPKVGCGDGIKVDEACDDGNTANNDGCSSACAIEQGFVCNGAQPSICWSHCGDGIVATNEKCDDGNTVNGDGCDAQCKTEIGYNCTGTLSVCTQPAVCGNAKIETGETCDDGSTRGFDGCSATCQLESSYTCTGAPSYCFISQVCGNQVVTGTESCDDGNTTGGDGCSATCQVETGYECHDTPSICRQP